MVFQLVDTAGRKIIADTTSMNFQQEQHIPQLGVGEAFIGYG